MPSDRTDFSIIKEGSEVHLYYHGNCFDGASSAAFLTRFLRDEGRSRNIELHPVQYGRNSEWAARDLSRPALVVDFLFHPGSEGWWDHHQTAFVTPGLREEFKARPPRFFRWEPGLPSCAALLSGHFRKYFAYQADRRLGELVRWATLIDSASYESAEQRLLARDPAIQIDWTFGGDEYNNWLVRQLAERSLTEIASTNEVKERFAARMRQQAAGMKEFERIARSADGVVAFEMEVREDMRIDRYLPFYFWENARFSVGLLRNQEGFYLLTMRNPWREVENYPSLGELCKRFGGGGHQRVGAVRFGPDTQAEAEEAFRSIFQTLRETKRGNQVQPV